MKHFIKSALLIAMFGMVLSLVFVRCGKKEEKVIDEEITKDSASTDAKLKLEQVFQNIPSPIEMSKELAKSGFTYNKNVMNSSSKSSSYSSNYKAAVNLGVFGADLGYSTSYAQTQDALGYLNTSKQLADKVGVGAAFDETMLKRFDGNIANKDTLESIINNAYDKASRNLRSNQRVSTAAVVASGGWIEALYITTQMLKGVPRTDKNEPVFNRAWGQLYAYTYVSEILTLYQKNADCAQLLKELAPVAELADAYGKKSTLTAEDITVISEKVAAVRNGLVN